MESLIGITGYARHGKDTAAQVLVEDYDYLRIGFADALKSMALVLNPIVRSEHGELRLAEAVEVEGWDVAKQNPEVRRFLQVLGTEGVRDHISDHAWVDALARKADPLLYDVIEPHWRAEGYESNPWEQYNGVVIPDVRFPNEAAYIQSEDGLLIMVRRPNYDNGVGLSHPSEQHIADMNPDVVIEAYSVEQLRDILRGVLRERLDV